MIDSGFDTDSVHRMQLKKFPKLVGVRKSSVLFAEPGLRMTEPAAPEDDTASLSVRSYLQATVTPAIASALGALEKESPPPESPIQFIARQLEEHVEQSRQ